MEGGSVATKLAAPLIEGRKLAVDTNVSVIEWQGSKVIGGAHHGTINVREGEIKMNDRDLVGGKIVVDMNSLVNLDLTSAEYNQQLVGHLKSADFFDVMHFPSASLEVKKATLQRNGEYKVVADLTIKDVTHSVEFVAKLDSAEKNVEVALEIDRTEWGLRYGSGKFFQNLGDKIISDKIVLKIKLGFHGPLFPGK